MQDKVTILFLTDRRKDWQMEKAKLMMFSFISKDEILFLEEFKTITTIETNTHYVRIVKLDQSPRGYRANFIFDLTGFKEAQDTEEIKSTYTWNGINEPLNKQLNNNGWD